MSEHFGARTYSSEHACLTEVDQCDVFVLILGANYRDLKDVLTRLPTQRASEIEQLLPHRWTPGRSEQSAFTL